jgi:hypothetical protein
MSTAILQEGHEVRHHHHHHHEFCVNVEGVDHEWDHDTITVPQIRELGHLPADQPVLEINLETNTERTLPENEIVHLKPGHAYCKKVKYKRG